VVNAELDRLPEMLARLGLKATRDRLDNLLDEAGRRDLSLREALSLVCAAEVAHREERRISMGLGIAKFPFVRILDGFEFDAQPSLDPKQVRDLATCRWVANGDALRLLGPPGVGKTQVSTVTPGSGPRGRSRRGCLPQRGDRGPSSAIDGPAAGLQCRREPG
jgi:DNA replication protein DnaC